MACTVQVAIQVTEEVPREATRAVESEVDVREVRLVVGAVQAKAVAGAVARGWVAEAQEAVEQVVEAVQQAAAAGAEAEMEWALRAGEGQEVGGARVAATLAERVTEGDVSAVVEQVAEATRVARQ